MEDKAQSSLLNRIEKLLALSKSSNPNEAAAALSRAQKLMSMHGISEHELSLSSISEEECEIMPGVRSVTISCTLANIVAECFGLERFVTMSSASTVKSIHLVGPKERLEPATHTCVYLQRQVKIAATAYRAETKKALIKSTVEQILVGKYGFTDPIMYHMLLNDYEPTSFTVFDDIVPYRSPKLSTTLKTEYERRVKSYLEGWLYSVYKKVQSFVSDNDSEIERLTNEYMDEHHPDLHHTARRRRRLTQSAFDAYKKGQKDGDEGFSLLQGVGGGKTHVLEHK